MEVTLTKTEKVEPVIHKVLINELTKNAIQELEGYTKGLREESGLKELFIVRYNKKFEILKVNKFSNRRLPNFIKR
jgi:hypothetical protein